MKFPNLVTRRLSLTCLNDGDASAIFDLFSNESVVEYYDLAALTDFAQAAELIKAFQNLFLNSTGIRWAIRSKDSGNLLGTCGFNSWNKGMKNGLIGYDLMPSQWNQGISTEAVSMIIDAAFSGALACGALHRIQADTIPGNIASEKLLYRLGFKNEGLRRECGYWKGTFHDLNCFGLLKSEFKKIAHCDRTPHR
jgi:[ribosomal protein S5]-alanine N-acetyltransferase